MKIFDKNQNSFHNDFVMSNTKYLKLSPTSFLTLDISDKDWDSSKSVLIIPNAIYSLKESFKDMIKIMREEKIYALKKNGELVIYKDEARRFIRKIPLLSTNHVILLEPAIIYDNNDIGYEGLNMFLNNSNNLCQIPIQHFESLWYTLETTDIFLYTQECMNYIAIMYRDELKEHKVKPVERKKVLFDDSPIEKSEANFRPMPNDEDVFGVLNERKI